MTRLQRILSGIVALQIVLAVVVFWPRSAGTVDSGPLFADLKTEDIVTVTLENGEGTRTELVRQGDGWVLGGSGDYPADATKIDPILAKIAVIQTNRLVAKSSDSHKRLKVADDDFNQRIQLELADGSVETLLVGSTPNPSGTHVRRLGQNETYLTGDLATWEVNPTVSNWIDVTYTSLNREDITSLTLANENGSFSFEKGDEGAWSLKDLAEGEEMDSSAISSLLSRVTAMRMTAPLGTTALPEYGLDDPQATVTAVIEDSENQSTKVSTLLVGAQDPDDDNYYVKWSDSDYYVKVAAFNVEEMLNNARDDFLMEPPTPTPESEATPGEVTATPTPGT